MPTIQDLLSKPDFDSLSPEAQQRLIGDYEPDFKKASPAAQANLLQAYKDKYGKRVKGGLEEALPTEVPGAVRAGVKFLDYGSGELLKDFAGIVGRIPGSAGEAGRAMTGAPKERGLSTLVAPGMKTPPIPGHTPEELFPEPTTTSEKIGKVAGQVLPWVAAIPEVRVAKGVAVGAVPRMLVGGFKGAYQGGVREYMASGGDPEKALSAAKWGALFDAGFEGMRGPLAYLLKKNARWQYAQILAPRGGKVQQVAKKILSGGQYDLLSKHISAWTTEGLEQKLSDKALEASENLNQAYKALGPNFRLKLQPLYDTLYKFLGDKALFSETGAIKSDEQFQRGVQMLTQITEKLGPYLGEASPGTLREFRQALEESLYKPNPLKITTKVRTVGEPKDEWADHAANAIRDMLNKDPDIGKWASIYHTFETGRELAAGAVLQDVGKTEEYMRRGYTIGRSVAMGYLGEREGKRRFGVPGAIAGAVGGLALSAAWTSTAWRSFSAVGKDKLADWLAVGEVNLAGGYAARQASKLTKDPAEAQKLKDFGDKAYTQYRADQLAKEAAQTSKARAAEVREAAKAGTEQSLVEQKQADTSLRRSRNELKAAKQTEAELKKAALDRKNEREALIQKKQSGTALTPDEEKRLAELAPEPKTRRPAEPRKKTALAAVPEGGTAAADRDIIPSTIPPATPLGPYEKKVITPNQTSARVRNGISELDDLDNSFSGGESYPPSWQPRPGWRTDNRFRVDLRKGDLNYVAMGDSGMAGDGAPIWKRGPDGRKKAVTRNAGTQALKELYDEGHPLAVQYKQELAANAASFGMTHEEVMAMKYPIHERELLEDWDEKTVAKFAEQANRQSVAGKGAAEQAVELAKMMTPDVLKYFHPDPETGAFNIEFVNELFKGLPEEILQTWRKADGTLSEDGEKVVNRALFARAYPKTGALETMAEKGDDSQIKNVIKGMSKAAPSFIQTSRSVLDKKMLAGADISEQVGQAAEEMEKAKKSRQTFENYTQQQGFEEKDPVVQRILAIFGKHNTSFNRIGDVLIEYNRLAYEMGNVEQFNLMGEAELPKSVDYLLNEADAHVQRRIDEEAEYSFFKQAQRKAAAGHSAESGGTGPPGEGEAQGGTQLKGPDTPKPPDEAPGNVSPPHPAPSDEGPLKKNSELEPSVRPGMTRLYRVDSPKGAGVPEWMQGNEKYEASKEATGRWFTKNRSHLEFYLKDAGPDATVSYVDVPNEHLESFRVSNQPAVSRHSANPDKEFFLPKDLAEKRIQTVRTPGVPTEFKRFDAEGDKPSVDKPHGLYVSASDIESPHEDIGPVRSTYTLNPEANILQVDTSGFGPSNRGAVVGKSAGLMAVEHFQGEAEYQRLFKLSKPELAAELKAKYPQVEWEKYYDQHEMLEGYGGMLAREHGYDGIWGYDMQAPQYAEFVGLTPKAFK